MTALNALERVLKSYNDYYNVTRDGISPPFIAEAAFHSNSTQYFLSKKVQLAHANSNEYVFFAVSDSLDQGEVEELARLAWDLGMERVSPHKNHRNTDVSLVILAENITPQASGLIKKLRHYRSYRFGLHGWSNFQVIAMETSSGKLAYNWHGRNLKGLFRNISMK